MILLIFSDTHRFKDKFGLLSIKDRLLEQLIGSKISDVDYIIHGGDGFDSRAYDSELATTESAIYQRAAGDQLEKVYLCVGNHDSQYQKYSPLSPYGVGSKINIVTAEPIEIKKDRECLVIQGWSGRNKIPDPLSADKNDKCFYFGHVNVADWLKSEKGVKLNELLFSPYKKHFFGDYHEHKIVGNVVSIGTLFPSSFKDADYRGGFLIYDTETDEIKRFTFPSKVYPVFKKYVVTPDTEQKFFDSILQRDIEFNIVRIVLEGSMKWLSDDLLKRVEQLKDFNPRVFEIKKFSMSKNAVTSVHSERPETDVRKLLAEEAKRQDWSDEIIELAGDLI